MLEKFSALGPVGPQRPPMPRVQAMAAARAKGRHTPFEWSQQIRAQKGLCYYCGQLPGDTPTHPRVLVKDHRTPVARGGPDSIDNIVAACEPCNGEKRDMTEAEYCEYRRARQAAI